MARLGAVGQVASLWVCVAACAVAGPSSAYNQPYKPIDGGAFDLGRGPAEYSLHPAGSDDISGDADLDALRDAFRAWACVEGTALRFIEVGEGVAVATLDDGINTLFWDEDDLYGLGPGTLGITLGDAGQGVRAQADIVFNGTDHTWSVGDDGSATDVGSIAAHEIGHFLGLDHPCDGGNGSPEANCNGPELSVMTPFWDGVPVRGPLPDDEEGVRALYPAENPDARCDGPYLLGERCTCDDECVEPYACVPGTDGVTVCAALCGAADGACDSGFACVLGPPEGDEAAPGACVKSDPGESPAGSICVARGECAEGDCALVPSVGRSVCRVDCGDDGDCQDGAKCIDGACLLGARGTACPAPDEPEPGCGCDATGGAPGTAALIAAAVAGLSLKRRRRDQ